MSKKILIVDDEEDVLAVLEKRVSGAGYQVIKANSGLDAVAKAKKELPDLIILDVLMPGMDGGDVASTLKQDDATKGIPIIFLSCLYTKKDETDEGHLIGENFFVSKPYKPDEFLDIIRDRLE